MPRRPLLSRPHRISRGRYSRTTCCAFRTSSRYRCRRRSCNTSSSSSSCIILSTFSRPAICPHPLSIPDNRAHRALSIRLLRQHEGTRTGRVRSRRRSRLGPDLSLPQSPPAPSRRVCRHRNRQASDLRLRLAGGRFRAKLRRYRAKPLRQRARAGTKSGWTARLLSSTRCASHCAKKARTVT